MALGSQHSRKSLPKGSWGGRGSADVFELGRVLGGLGGVLGGSLEGLGWSRKPLGPKMPGLVAVFLILDPFLDPKGRPKSIQNHPKGSQTGLKVIPK